MRFPTGDEVTRLRSSERNFSRVYLGVQRGKDIGDFSSGTLMVGQRLQLGLADGYVDNEHLLYFGSANLNGTDIRPNMTLLVGTTTDPSAYGSVRIRAIGLNAAPTGDDGLYLEPNELHALGYLQPGDCIWIDGIYRLYRKLPYIVNVAAVGTVFEDGNPNTALGAAGIPGYGIAWAATYNDRPVALMGSPRFAWTGEEIDFYGWRSHGRGGRSIQNWTWDFDGGVCVGPGIGFPGSPGHPVHARWDSAGEYIASLVVEDDSGNNANDDYGVPFDRHRAVRPVLVYDRPGEGLNTPYMNFEVESLTGKYGSGWSCRITVFGTADKTEFPDNALIIIYAEDWYGNQRGSIGGWYGQEGILFCGYIRANSVVADFEKSTVSFEAQTIEQWMKEIDLWPANCLDPAAAASAWQEFDDMTVEDVLWYLTEMRSNLKDVADCFFASDVGVEKTLGFVDLTEASLYNQMSEQLGSCFFGKLSASRYGSVHLFKHKNMMDMAERAWWGPPVYSFSRQDWRDEIQIGEERMRNSVAQVDFIGFVYDANGNPLEVYSLAPARQTNFGGIEKVTGILLSGNSIAAGQAENNTLSGLYLAWKNIRFPHIRVPTRHNNRVLEPAEQDYFAVVLAASDTERGYVWAGKEFLTTGVSIKIDNENGIIDVDIEGEASTWGPDGVAGEYPYDPPADNPPADNPPGLWPVWPPPYGEEGSKDLPPWGEEPEGGGVIWPITVYMALWSGEVIRGVGMGPGVQMQNRCTFHNCGQSPTAGNLFWIALDEFNAVNTAMVCTYNPNEVWKMTNLKADTPTWTKMFGPILGDNGTNILWTVVRSSSVQQGLWMVAGYEATAPLAKVYVRWTLDGGIVWNATSFTGGNATGSYAWLEMSTHDADRAWTMQIDGTTGQTHIHTTNDMWASAPTLTTIPLTCFSALPYMPVCHHRDYENDDDSEVLYGGGLWGGWDYARVYKDATCVNLYATNVGDAPHTLRVGCGVGTPNRWWAMATDDDIATGFFISDDGVIWTMQSDWTRSATTRSRDCRNMARDWQSYVAARDGIAYPIRLTDDRGETWHPQWGGIPDPPGNSWTNFLTAEGLANPQVHCICSPSLLP